MIIWFGSYYNENHLKILICPSEPKASSVDIQIALASFSVKSNNYNSLPVFLSIHE